MRQLLPRTFANTVAALFGLVLLAVGLSAVPAAAASADPVPAPGAAPTSGWVRFGHFAPSAQAVDFLIDGQPVAKDINFRQVTGYQSVPAGVHQFAIVDAANPTGPPVLQFTSGVSAHDAVTVGAVTTRSGLASQVYDDTPTTPPAGQALVRFIHTSPDVPAVNVSVLNGARLASNVAYPIATPYQPVPAGTYDISVTDASSGVPLLQIDQWHAIAGSQESVVIVRQSNGQLDVVPISDTSGTGSVPVGGMQTGLGGTAPHSGTAGWGLGGLLVLGILATAAATIAARLTSRSGLGAQGRVALVATTFAGLTMIGCSTETVPRATAVTAHARSSRPPVPEKSTTAPAGATGALRHASGQNTNQPTSIGDPTGITIEAIGVHSGLERLGVADDGTAQVPKDPQVAGWFSAGTRPGDAGPAVILGHIDSKTGPAVFYRLHELRAGDSVTVTTPSGPVSFTVDRTEQVAKDHFPTAAVYGPVPDPELRLVTCGGSFDESTGHYVDNVIVFLSAQGVTAAGSAR